MLDFIEQPLVCNWNITEGRRAECGHKVSALFLALASEAL